MFLVARLTINVFVNNQTRGVASRIITQGGRSTVYSIIGDVRTSIQGLSFFTTLYKTAPAMVILQTVLLPVCGGSSV